MHPRTRQAWIALPVLFTLGAALAWLGSQNGIHAFGWPVFALCGALAFGLNMLAFVPAFAFQTERYFDLTGSLSYLALVGVALGLGNRDPRSVLLAGMVVLWAIRLGLFLFTRIREDGSDGRFDTLKPDFARFLMTWTLQGLWVFITLSCALAAMTTRTTGPIGGGSAGSHPAWGESLDPFAFVGCALFLVGFAIEIAADRQKRVFRRDPANRDRFIQSGLWAWSRHPNYFGEIVLWCGIAIVALPVLSGWQYATLVSPLFVLVLLTRISGIPLLEARGRRRWGDEPAYRDYLARTPALVPRRPW